MSTKKEGTRTFTVIAYFFRNERDKKGASPDQHRTVDSEEHARQLFNNFRDESEKFYGCDIRLENAAGKIIDEYYK